MLGQKRLPKIYWWLLLMLLCIATITLVNLVPHHILGPEPTVEPERGPLFTRAQDPLAERVVFEHPAEGVALFPVELEATRRTSLLERGERRACMLVAHWSWRSEANTELRYNYVTRSSIVATWADRDVEGLRWSVATEPELPCRWGRDGAHRAASVA